MKKYKLYIFDFDGTLVDSYLSMIDIFDYSFAAIGESCTHDQVLHYMRGSLQACIEERGFMNDQNKVSKFVASIMECLDNPTINAKTIAYDDVAKTIRFLKQTQSKLAIVTGNNVPHVQEILGYNKLDNVFDAFVGSDNCKFPKPMAEPINMIFDMIPGFNKEDACYIGDSLNDYQCAVNAGVDGYLLDRNGEYTDFNGPKISTLEELIINL